MNMEDMWRTKIRIDDPASQWDKNHDEVEDRFFLKLIFKKQGRFLKF